MDRIPPANPEIQQLIQRSAAARACLTGEAVVLRRRLDFPARIRHSLMDHPAAWGLVSLASGFAASLVFRRKPASRGHHQSIPATLFGLTLTAARPLLEIWLGQQLKQWLAGPSCHALAGRLLTRPSPTSKSL